MSESVRLFPWPRLVAFALIVALLPISSASVEAYGEPVVQGSAMAVDGDTLDVSGQRVRLEGIDAPEYSQTCARSWVGTWDCGKQAQRALAKMVAGQTVECRAKGRDRYDRILGICSVGGRDLNSEMVRTGLAWAFTKYSKTYAAVEAEARAEKLGVWQAETEPAWTFREHRWQSAEQTAPAGCAIKGNVTDKGHIYHLPWSPWYSKVKVETEKGERWFCSETEAAAAGWRPAVIN